MSLVPWGIWAASSGAGLEPAAGYSLWLDGKDSASFSFSSGALVSEWRDKSGNDYHFSQGTVSNQPIRSVSKLVTFDGSNDLLQASTKFMNNAHNGGSNSFFIVSEITTVRAGDQIILGTNSNLSAERGFMIAYGSSSGSLRSYVSNGTTGQDVVFALSTTSQSAGSLGVWNLRLDANASVSSRAEYYFNTGSVETGSNSSGSSPSASDSTFLPTMGAYGKLDNYAAIKIAEILWYESDLGTTDREATRDYLIRKWGI